MRRVVFRNLGRPSSKVRLGPGVGLDNAIVQVGGGRVMILTVDPISIMPAIGTGLSAWLSVHLVASDYTTSGCEPQYATFAYNFPPSMGPSDREEYVRSVGRECERLGVSIVGGHTGSYPGGGFTVIGAGTMMGLSREGWFVDPTMARVEDTVLMTKDAAIEATSSLALSFPGYTERKVGTRLARRARRMIRSVTTVQDALAAAEAGLGPSGVTSMHDATEGGVLGALDEMATASGHRFTVDLESIAVSHEARQVCAAFGIDPLGTMGEGALLLTCNPHSKKKLESIFRDHAIVLREVGSVSGGSGLWIRREGRTGRVRSENDPYWGAYERSVTKGLD